MSDDRKQKVEFGDFQTPDHLSRQVCQLLLRLKVEPASIVEPTCGKGAFLQASADAFPRCTAILGFEINSEHVRTARTVHKAQVRCDDFFERDWPGTLGSLPEPLLVIGNPPWVTNSVLGSLGSGNLPAKSNYQRHSGLDAITGKSNFDISEAMLRHLLDCLSGRSAVVAMLCKTAVARKVLQHAWTTNLAIQSARIYSIDAAKNFGAAVDACLLVCILEPGTTSRECSVYADLLAPELESVFALRDGRLVANLDAFEMYGHLYGVSPLKWRSGVKHDCSRVMELSPRGHENFENGLGEIAKLEPTFLYPMLKSSELAKPNPAPSRYMLVTQKTVGEDTSRIRSEAPCTWNYLVSHATHLDGRASSIYRNRPRFSVFGVGPYSFAPWKVAISGFYKQLKFRCVGPVQTRPVILDDTCYFLPCQTEERARIIAELLNSEHASGFFRSLVFWDAKRPITAQLLANLDIRMLAAECGIPFASCTDAAHDLPLFEHGQ